MATEHANGQAESRHEVRDANIHALLRFAAWLFASLVIVAFLMGWMFWHFNTTQELGPPPTPFESARALPPLPRLQTEPQHDLRAYRTAQQESLTQFGWVDRKNGVVRIPIDRAMELLLQEGLPVRASAAQKSPEGTGKAPVPPRGNEVKP